MINANITFLAIRHHLYKLIIKRGSTGQINWHLRWSTLAYCWPPTLAALLTPTLPERAGLLASWSHLGGRRLHEFGGWEELRQYAELRKSLDWTSPDLGCGAIAFVIACSNPEQIKFELRLRDRFQSWSVALNNTWIWWLALSLCQCGLQLEKSSAPRTAKVNVMTHALKQD